MKIKVADTKTFMNLAKQAEKERRNHHLSVRMLERSIDPEGTHVVSFSMMHNDTGVRTQWLLKMKDSLVPSDVWLDLSFSEFNSLIELEAAPTQK